MRRSHRLRLVAVLALAVTARAAHAVPATTVRQIGALRCCVDHCRQMRSLGEASRCCGVDMTAADPSRLPAASRLEPPVPSMEGVLPAAPRLSLVQVGRLPEPVRATATGPPLYLRLGSLIL